MNGARKLALDTILPLLKPGMRVLDVCCGDAWLREHVQNARAIWFGIDKNRNRPRPGNVFNLADDTAHLPSRLGYDDLDLAITVYGTQHLLGNEAQGWLHVKSVLKPGGKFLWIGRAANMARELKELKGSAREMDRQDPLNAYTPAGINALATACGFRTKRIELFEYEGDSYKRRELAPNAMAALFERE